MIAKLPLDNKKIDELRRICLHYNIFPDKLPFYINEEKHPVRKIATPLIEESINYFKILEKTEFDSFISNLPPGIKFFLENDSRINPQNDDYYERVALHYLMYELRQGYLSFKEIVKQDLKTSVVLQIYPELFELFDSDGLLLLDDRFKLFDGGVEYKEHIFHYNQFLRRGFTGNPNYEFLLKFINFYKKTKSYNKIKISIDHKRIMPKDFYRNLFEFDTWFGPEFNKEEIDNPNIVGLTIKKRIKPSIFDYSNKLDRTEFYWSFDGKLKTLEIEEISEPDYKFDDFNINKYFHTQRDIETKTFIHLDGAVKLYYKNYNERYNSNMPKEPRSDKKIKLFRIDGNIELEYVQELVSFFYKENEMIIEYFDKEKYEKEFETLNKLFRESKK